MEEQEVPAVEHGHEHQEGQGQGPQEEEDLLYQEPCQHREEGRSHQTTPTTPRHAKLWNRVDRVSDPCSAAV